MAVQYHQGCRWPLVRDVLMPALAKETTAVLQCGTLTGHCSGCCPLKCLETWDTRKVSKMFDSLHENVSKILGKKMTCKFRWPGGSYRSHPWPILSGWFFHPAGDAADKEQQRLNDALSGLAASLAGGIQGLVWGVWRRGTVAKPKRRAVGLGVL